MADVLLQRSKGTSIVLVIFPLKALMEDQVDYLNSLSISAISVTDEHNDKTVVDIIDGRYSHVYGSPECFLSTRWRGLFTSKKFRSSLVCVAVDEAHTLVNGKCNVLLGLKLMFRIRALCYIYSDCCLIV